MRSAPDLKAGASMATKICDVDLADGPRSLTVPAPYRTALLLLRWRGRPVGQVRMEANGGLLPALDVWRKATEAAGDRLVRAILADLMPQDAPPTISGPPALPTGSVVVCTRDRPEDLRRFLDSVCPVAGRDVEVIVVDNAPPDDRTARVAADYPVRYVCEPRKGLNWARGKGARTATGKVVIYTDDDVVVDRGWIDAMRRPFADPGVAAVTGLVVPIELETTAQEQFERFVGFGRGFDRREFSIGMMSPISASRVGAGASMAVRRDLVLGLGLFDVELDCGTAARSSGDHYAFYRLLSLGYRLVYNPEALSWHRHRRGHAELSSQLFDYSVGVYCWLLRALVFHREDETFSVGSRWFLGHHVRQLGMGLIRHPDAQPLSLTLAEVRGVLIAPFAFLASLRQEKAMSRAAGGALHEPTRGERSSCPHV